VHGVLQTVNELHFVCFYLFEGLGKNSQEGYRVGQKPVDADTIASVLSIGLDALEARLMRNGYNVKVLSEILNAKPREIRSFLCGQLPSGRTQELHQELLAAGVPL